MNITRQNIAHVCVAAALLALTSCDVDSPVMPDAAPPVAEPVGTFVLTHAEPEMGGTLRIIPAPYEDRAIVEGTYTLDESLSLPVWTAIVFVRDDGTRSPFVIPAQGQRALFPSGTFRAGDFLVTDGWEDLQGDGVINALFLVGKPPLANGIDIIRQCGSDGNGGSYTCVEWNNLSSYELVELNWTVYR